MAFLFKILAHVNILAVIISGVAYWLLGAIWFSLIFGKTWSSELEKHGVKISDPGKGGMAGKFISTFIFEIFIAFACATLVWVMGIENLGQALKLGLGLGVFFAALPMMIAYSWESRPLKLVLIDIGYPVTGVTLCVIILTFWK
ncbi:MAG: DUF1761 domain-containing protein [Bacteroidetes bacterium]|nr:DUF1761 domain-containing protein [Bacteroidota bacterium]